MTYIKHNSAKANALRGQKIGGGGISLTPPGGSRAHQIKMISAHRPRTGPAPRTAIASVVMGSLIRRAKKGGNPKWGDVLDIRTKGGAPVYERTVTGEIRKVVA